jgi:predicted small secreted protein
MRMRSFVVALMALTLAACATAQKLGAANDVHALLIAIRDNDHAAFDAHVDHEALKADLQSKIEQQLSTNKKMKGLAALLGPSTLDLADQLLVQPKTFRMVAEQYGYRADTQIPGAVVISQALKTLPDGRVCATKKKDGPCLLVFTKEQGVWKLTGFQGDSSMLRLKL